MASYRRRLEADLDRWIAAGLVPAQNRAAILERASGGRRLDAATALAVVGVLLLGAAVIAFVAANWDQIPRVLRFVLVLAAFLAAAGGGAWASSRGRPVARNALVTLAALIYAAAIGLTGQIFDIAGDPQNALRSAGAAAGLLALVGRSSGAAMAALALIGLGDLAPDSFGVDQDGRWLVFAAPVGVGLAWLWRSIPLAHAAGLAMVVGWMILPSQWTSEWLQMRHLLSAFSFAVFAAVARWRTSADDPAAPVFYGWFVWGALAFFAAAGLGGDAELADIMHRAGWLVLGAAAVALGRHDRHALVTAGGIVALIAAVSVILFDLGLGLLAAAGVFAACALVALAAGVLLRGRISA